MTKDVRQSPEALSDHDLDDAQGGGLTAQKDLNITVGGSDDEETQHTIKLQNATVSSIKYAR